MSSLAIGYEDPTLLGVAQQLAKRLNLVINNHAKQQLLVTAERLVLKINDFSPLYADFSRTAWQKRHHAGKKQGLVRTCKPAPGIKIIDATAGWGRDAAVLASFGADVLMLERHPVMAILLADALLHRDEYSKDALRLSLYHVDAMHYLQTLAPGAYPDVIYIDPMHPERQKSALVKKEMQVLQHLIENKGTDLLSLLQIAYTKALQRVVVKWPQHLPPLMKPTYSVPGTTVRFDCFISN